MTKALERTPGIRWWRVLGGGFLIELLLMAVAVPFFATGRAEALSIVIVPATLLVAIPCGAWAARGTATPVLNGALAGAAAIALYCVIAIVGMLAAPDQADLSTVFSPAYLGSHLCKVLGGALGGWWVARRAAA
ncbi:MAG TPA: hypothetical protein VFS49_06330 [Croceibacterium sp.]|nr:hypothetical protein [Croceibacterium sp.]